VAAADEQIYAAHENDPRPNPLFDAQGNRLKLSATDPRQAALREEWCDLYQAALAKKKSNASPGSTTPTPASGSNAAKPPSGANPVGNPVQPCSKLHWIKIRLLRLPDAQPRPEWWKPDGAADPYPSEPCTIELTNGTEIGALDGQGSTEHTSLPPGVCSIHFTRFYKLIAKTLGPPDLWPGMSPRGAGGASGGGLPVPPADKIRLVEVAEVVTAADGTDNNESVATRDQYINMPAENAHPDLGRSVRLRARVEWTSGAKKSLAGQNVYWYFTPDGGNRNGLPASLQAGFEQSGKARFTSTTGADGWTDIVHFIPSQYGGDRFKVFGTDNGGYTGGLAAGEYTVWRRVFYELDCMKRAEGGTYSDRADIAGMEDKLNAAFIDPVATGTDGEPDHVRMIGEHEVEAWATGFRDGSGAPRYYHLVLIDTIAWDPAPVPRTFACGNGNDTIVLSAATYLLKAGAWFGSATYDQGVHKGAIPAANLSLVETGDPSSGNDAFVITVNWNGLPVDPTQAVRVRLTFTNWTEGSGLQVPTGPATIIGVRWRERSFRATPDKIGKSTLNTMLHEPGHAMGLAPATLPDGTANANQYNKAGSHCHALSNKCVMYEANSGAVEFCPDCADGLKGRNLKALPIGGSAAY
jgi:hypothetical protein